MKKIILSLLFIAFSISMNAQSIVDRQTIKDSPNELLTFVEEDLVILSNNFTEITDSQKKELNHLMYYKYKMLTSDLTSEELVNLTESMKERTRNILGDDLYITVSENQPIFNRITGLAYLAQ